MRTNNVLLIPGLDLKGSWH